MGRSVIKRTFACLPEGKPECLRCCRTYKDVSSALPCGVICRVPARQPGLRCWWGPGRWSPSSSQSGELQTTQYTAFLALHCCRGSLCLCLVGAHRASFLQEPGRSYSPACCAVEMLTAVWIQQKSAQVRRTAQRCSSMWH